MKLAVIILAFVCAFHTEWVSSADPCVPDKCTIKNNCRCSSATGPLALNVTPQLIVLAFVDAARSDIYKDIWSPLVEPRKNPDQQFISATFYVPHEYSDYQIVHDLAVNGFEIGIHSVTNEPHQEYWRNATQALLEQEFGSQRKIISKFANIPIQALTGTLTPQLQLAGDRSIKAFVSQNFTYDNSWPSKTSLYPYTLDYSTAQTCDIGSCPTGAYPGFWISPIVDLRADDGDVCATLAGCFRTRNNQTTKEISDWLVGQVKSVKDYNRAPLTLVVEENFFSSIKNAWNGLNEALNQLQKDKEIFFVSQARVIQWLKDPKPIANFTTSASTISTGCVKSTCALQTNTGETRYMVSCVPCPKNYPWLDNPEGK